MNHTFYAALLASLSVREVQDRCAEYERTLIGVHLAQAAAFTSLMLAIAKHSALIYAHWVSEDISK